MLLLFPVSAFFSVFLLFPSSSPPSSLLPSPPWLPWLLLVRSCKMVDMSFCVVSSSINVLNKTEHVYKTCTNWFSATCSNLHQVIRLSSITCSPCLAWSSEYSWRCLIRTCVVECAVCCIYLQPVNEVLITILVVSEIG